MAILVHTRVDERLCSHYCINRRYVLTSWLEETTCMLGDSAIGKVLSEALVLW